MKPLSYNQKEYLRYHYLYHEAKSEDYEYEDELLDEMDDLWLMFSEEEKQQIREEIYD